MLPSRKERARSRLPDRAWKRGGREGKGEKEMLIIQKKDAGMPKLSALFIHLLNEKNGQPGQNYGKHRDCSCRVHKIVWLIMDLLGVNVSQDFSFCLLDPSVWCAAPPWVMRFSNNSRFCSYTTHRAVWQRCAERDVGAPAHSHGQQLEKCAALPNRKAFSCIHTHTQKAAIQ